jgi:hypothetical protein
MKINEVLNESGFLSGFAQGLAPNAYSVYQKASNTAKTIKGPAPTNTQPTPAPTTAQPTAPTAPQKPAPAPKPAPKVAPPQVKSPITGEFVEKRPDGKWYREDGNVVNDPNHIKELERRWKSMAQTRQMARGGTAAQRKLLATKKRGGRK